MDREQTKGFVTVSIKRGFQEIETLFTNITVLGGVICGGYVRYCASPLPEPVKAADVDIYCVDDRVFDAIKKHMQEEMKLEKRHENNMALTFKRPKEGPYAYAPPIQLIKPVREGAIVANGTMEEILDNFDFTVIRCGLIDQHTALADKDFEEDEKHRRLRIKKIHCPISSTLRCLKYAKKGYWCRPFDVLGLFLDWERREPGYRDKIVSYLMKSAADPKSGLTKEEVEELEALMRID
jgi:hypothetical protein